MTADSRPGVTLLRRAFDRTVAGPDYPPNLGDLADIRVFGLALPVRASIAVLAVTALLIADQTWALLPGGPVGAEGFLGIGPTALIRFLLFLVVPVAIILLVFRDEPRRYGLRLGDWRLGLGLLLAGLVVMTPIILGLSTLESFRLYYGTTTEPLGTAILDNLVELVSAEFILRGFLMFALWRRVGPLALVLALVPFVLTHLGKPDIELWSTFLGGSIFAWLDWRTGSILWSALGHVFVLTLMSIAVGGATLGG